MKPIDQTTFGSPYGNCFQACVASILELPLEDVPHFCEGDNPRWLLDLEEWLRPRGLAPMLVQAEGCPALDDAYGLLGGPSPRGCNHSVVVRGVEVVHDPHPSREGLLEARDYLFFVQLQPWRIEQVAVELDRMATMGEGTELNDYSLLYPEAQRRLARKLRGAAE